MNIFHQSTGELFWPNGTLAGKGYAGREAGCNNPAMENVKGIGPLPRGFYTGVELREHDPVVGAYVIMLQPDPENEMFGRNSFFMHGDSVEHPGLASHGCIVMPREVRETFWNGEDHRIQVVI